MKNIKQKLIILCLILIISLTIVLLPKGNKILKVNDNKNLANNRNIALMFEKEDGSYEESNSNVWPSSEDYIFNIHLSKCDKGGKLSYDETKNIINVKSNKTEKCYLYFDEYNYENYCKNSDDSSFTCDVLRVKDDTIIYHNGSIKDDKGNVTDANDLSYRFAGTSEKVNNYVCLDGTTSDGECGNTNNLYRIIGIFKNEKEKYEVKLIKFDYATAEELGNNGAYERKYIDDDSTYKDKDNSYYRGNTLNLEKIGGYYWTSSSNSVNEWSDSELRNTNLNDYYLNTYLATKIMNIDKLITTHIWSLNGNDNYASIPKVMYDSEMDKVESSPTYPTKTKTKENKIGLIYASDYGYSASPSSTDNWTKNLRDYKEDTIKNNNWLYMGLLEWTISRGSNIRSYAIIVEDEGHMALGYVHSDMLAVRPCFYLSSDTKIKSGNGSIKNPYRLSL